MIIDGHRHLSGSLDDILREMDALGVDRTVLVGVGVKDLSFVSVRDSPVFRSYLLTWLLGTFKGQLVANRLKRNKQLLGVPGNDPVIQAVKRHPDRFSGFAFLNPGHPDVIEEAKRCLEAGMCGLKFALLQYPAPIAGAVMRDLCGLAGSCNVPVFIHIGSFYSSYCFEKIVLDFPNVTFIIAHAGAQRFWRSLIKGRKFDNVFYDLSSYYVTPAKIRILLKVIGYRRLLFGSDVPVMADSPKRALDMIRSLGLPSEEESAILGGNLEIILNRAGCGNNLNIQNN